MNDNVVVKEPYEISVWENQLVPEYTDEETGKEYLEHFEEQKLAIIGANDMDTPFAAHNPNLVLNVNGSVTLTFEMFYRCFDEWYGEEGDFRDNPYTSLLNNEAKIKFKFRDKWYDLLIKKVEENSENYTFKYTTSSFFITELSKNGFKVELDTELENNQGTVTDLALKIMKETDWIIDVDNSDILVQTITEPIYGAFLSKDILVEKVADYMPDPKQKDTVKDIKEVKEGSHIYYRINSGERVYFFYSDLQAKAPQPLILYRPMKTIFLPPWEKPTVDYCYRIGIEDKDSIEKREIYLRRLKDFFSSETYYTFRDSVYNTFSNLLGEKIDKLTDIVNVNLEALPGNTEICEKMIEELLSFPGYERVQVIYTGLYVNMRINKFIQGYFFSDKNNGPASSIWSIMFHAYYNAVIDNQEYRDNNIPEIDNFQQKFNEWVTPLTLVKWGIEDYTVDLNKDVITNAFNYRIIDIINDDNETPDTVESNEINENMESQEPIENINFSMTYHGEDGKTPIPDIVQDALYDERIKIIEENTSFTEEEKQRAIEALTNTTAIYQQIGNTWFRTTVTDDILFAPSNNFRGKKVIRSPRSTYDVNLEWPVTIYTRSDEYLNSLINLDDIDSEFEPNKYGYYVKVGGRYIFDKDYDPQYNGLTRYSKKEYYGYIHTEDYSPNLAQNYLANSYDYANVDTGWVFDGTPSTQDDLANGKVSSEEDGAFTGQIYYLNSMNFQLDPSVEVAATSVLEMRLKNLQNERFYKDSTGKYFKTVVQVVNDIDNVLGITDTVQGEVNFHKLWDATTLINNSAAHILGYKTIIQYLEMNSATVEGLRQNYLDGLKTARGDEKSPLYETYKDKTDEELEQITDRIISDQRYSKSPRVAINTGVAANRDTIKTLNKGEQYIFAISLGRYKEGEEPPQYGIDSIKYGSSPPDARYRFVPEEEADPDAFDFAIKEVLTDKENYPLNFVPDPWKINGIEYQKVYNETYNLLRNQYNKVFYEERWPKNGLDLVFMREGGKGHDGQRHTGAWDNGTIAYRTAYRVALTQLLSQKDTWRRFAAQAKIAYYADDGTIFQADNLEDELLNTVVKDTFGLTLEAGVKGLLLSEAETGLDITISSSEQFDEDELEEIGSETSIFDGSVRDFVIEKGIFKRKTPQQVSEFLSGTPGHYEEGVVENVFIYTPKDFSICSDEDIANVKRILSGDYTIKGEWEKYHYPNYTDEQNIKIMSAINSVLQNHKNETFANFFDGNTMKSSYKKEFKKAIKKAIRQLWWDVQSPSREKNAKYDHSLCYPVWGQLNNGGYEYQKWENWWNLCASKMATTVALEHTNEIFGLTDICIEITDNETFDQWKYLETVEGKSESISHDLKLIKLNNMYYLEKDISDELEKIKNQYKDYVAKSNRLEYCYYDSEYPNDPTKTQKWDYAIEHVSNDPIKKAYLEQLSKYAADKKAYYDLLITELINSTSYDLDYDRTNPQHNTDQTIYYKLNPYYIYLLNHENDILKLVQKNNVLKKKYGIPYHTNDYKSKLNHGNSESAAYNNIYNSIDSELYYRYVIGLSGSGGLSNEQFVSDYLFLFKTYAQCSDLTVSEENLIELRNGTDKELSFPLVINNQIFSPEQEIPCPDEFLSAAWRKYANDKDNVLSTYTYVHNGGSFEIIDTDDAYYMSNNQKKELNVEINNLFENTNYGVSDSNDEELNTKVKEKLMAAGITGIMMPISSRISSSQRDLYVRTERYEPFTPDVTKLQSYNSETKQYDFQDFFKTYQDCYVTYKNQWLKLQNYWNVRAREQNEVLELLSGENRTTKAQQAINVLIKEILSLSFYITKDCYKNYDDSIHGNSELWAAAVNMDFTKKGSYYLDNGDNTTPINVENKDLDYTAGYFRPYNEELDQEALGYQWFDGQLGVSKLYDTSYELVPCYDGIAFYYPQNEQWIIEADEKNQGALFGFWRWRETDYSPSYFANRPFDSNGEQLLCLGADKQINGTYVKTSELDQAFSNWLGKLYNQMNKIIEGTGNKVALIFTNIRKWWLEKITKAATGVNEKVNWLINDDWLAKKEGQYQDADLLSKQLSHQNQMLKLLQNDLYQDHPIDFILANPSGTDHIQDFYGGKQYQGRIRIFGNGAVDGGIQPFYYGYYFKTRGNNVVDQNADLQNFTHNVAHTSDGDIDYLNNTVIHRAFDKKIGALVPPTFGASTKTEDIDITISDNIIAQDLKSETIQKASGWYWKNGWLLTRDDRMQKYNVRRENAIEYIKLYISHKNDSTISKKDSKRHPLFSKLDGNCDTETDPKLLGLKALEEKLRLLTTANQFDENGSNLTGCVWADYWAAVTWLLEYSAKNNYELMNFVVEGTEVHYKTKKVVSAGEQYYWAPFNTQEEIVAAKEAGIDIYNNDAFKMVEIIPFTKYRWWAFNQWGKHRYRIIPPLAAKRVGDNSENFKLLNNQNDLRKQTYIYVPLDEVDSALIWASQHGKVDSQYKNDLKQNLALIDQDKYYSYTLTKQEELEQKYRVFGKLFARTLTVCQNIKKSFRKTFRITRGKDTSSNSKELISSSVEQLYDVSYSLYSLLYDENKGSVEWVRDNKDDYFTAIKDDQWSVTTYEPKYNSLGRKKDGEKTLYYYDYENNYFRPYKRSDATYKLFDLVVGPNTPVFEFETKEDGSGNWMYFAANDWYIPINKDRFTTPKRYKKVRDFDNGGYVLDNGNFVNFDGYMNARTKEFTFDYSGLEVSFCDSYDFKANDFAINLTKANVLLGVKAAGYDANKKKYLYFDCALEPEGTFDTTVVNESVIDESKTLERWVYWKAEVNENFSLTENLVNPIGMVFSSTKDKDYAFIGTQLFKYYPYYADLTEKEAEQNRGENEPEFAEDFVVKKMVIPGEIVDTDELSYQSYYIYDPEIMEDVDSITYEYVGPEPFDNGWAYDYDEKCQKIRSIKGKESNYFNLIQSLCETFECWADFSPNDIYEEDGSGRFKYREAKVYIQKIPKEESDDTAATASNNTEESDDTQTLIDSMTLQTKTYPYYCFEEIPIEVKKQFIKLDTDAYDGQDDELTVAGYYDRFVEALEGGWVKNKDDLSDYVPVSTYEDTAAMTQYCREKKSDKQIEFEKRQKAIKYFENEENVKKHFDIKYMKVPEKRIVFKEYVGKDNYAGFKYGVNLKSTKRTLDSAQFTSRIIVKPNTNKYADNKFCTIQRAQDNFLKENFFYNFDYYIQHGMLKYTDILNDLYSSKDEHLGYFTKLHYLNEDLDKLAKRLADLSISIDKLDADYQTAALGRKSATEEIQKLVNLIQGNYDTYGQLIDSPWTFNKSKQYVERAEKGVTTLAHDYDATFYINGIATTSTLHIPTTMLTVDYPKYNDTLRTWFDEMDVYQNKYTAYHTAELKYKDLLDKRKEEKRMLEELQQKIVKKKEELNELFYHKYSRYIQEGTWTNNDYLDDNLYFLDALSVLRNSAFPKVSYQIGVVDLYPLEDYQVFNFEIGDRTYVEDTEFFGYVESTGRPAQEEIVVSEISFFPEDPIKNSIKVQNYRTQFEDLFKRITAQSQQLKFSESNYGMSSTSLGGGGAIGIGGLVTDASFDNFSLTQISDGIITLSSTLGTQLKLSGDTIVFQNGNKIMTVASVKGTAADQLVGQLNLDNLVIGSESKPSLKLDRLGLSAYALQDDGSPNYNKFVRHDQYGLYGIELDGTTRTVNDTFTGGLDEIEDKANFALTWNGFMLRSGDRNNRVKIGTDTDIRMQASDGANWKDRIVMGRMLDRNSEEYYGFRILNNQDEVVLETQPDGELYLKRRLRISNFAPTLSGISTDELIAQKDSSGDIYYIDPLSGERDVESRVNLGIVEVFKRDRNTGVGYNIFTKENNIPNNYDSSTYLTKVLSIAANKETMSDSSVFEQFNEDQIREYETFVPYTPTVNDSTQLYIYDKNSNEYVAYIPGGKYDAATDTITSKDYSVEQYESIETNEANESENEIRETSELQFYRKIEQTGLLAHNETFALFDNGNLVAKNAYVEGNIHATTGDIGGLEIKQGNLQTKNFPLYYKDFSDGVEKEKFEPEGAGYRLGKDGTIRLHNGQNYIIADAHSLTITGYTQFGEKWRLDPNESLFKNVTVKGTLSTSIFEEQSIQTVNSTLLLRNSYKIKTIEKLDDENYYKIDIGKDNLVNNTTHFIQIVSLEDNETTDIVLGSVQNDFIFAYFYSGLEVEGEIDPEKYFLIEWCEINNDNWNENRYNSNEVAISISAANRTTVGSNPRSITISQIGIKNNNGSYQLDNFDRVILGEIPLTLLGSKMDIETFTQNPYGLYSDNAFLKGIYILGDTAGISSYSNQNFYNVFSSEDKVRPSSSEQNSLGKVILWAGNENDPYAFAIDNKGNARINKGYFQGEIYGTIISASTLKAAKIIGNNEQPNEPALSIYDNGIGLKFGKSSESTDTYLSFSSNEASFNIPIIANSINFKSYNIKAINEATNDKLILSKNQDKIVEMFYKDSILSLQSNSEDIVGLKQGQFYIASNNGIDLVYKKVNNGINIYFEGHNS